MKPKSQLIIGGILVVGGLLIIAFSVQIASLIGTKHSFAESVEGTTIDAIKTASPRISAIWSSVMAALGFVVCAFGTWISGVKIKFRPKKSD